MDYTYEPFPHVTKGVSHKPNEDVDFAPPYLLSRVHPSIEIHPSFLIELIDAASETAEI